MPSRSASTRSPARRRNAYGTHVDQMIRQVLLTAPGERVDLPEFGCGLRQLLFAPNSDALQATAQLMVQRALNRWLADQIQGVRRHGFQRRPAGIIRRFSSRSSIC